MAAIALVLGWLGVWARREFTRNSALAAIRRLGGEVTYLRESGHPLQVTVSFDRVPALTDASFSELAPHLQGLHDLGELHSVRIGEAPIGNRSLDVVGKLTSLKFLALVATNISDEGLPQLHELSNLIKLNLERNRITDCGLRHLHTHKGLRHLFIRDTYITRKGLRDLQAALPDTSIEVDPDSLPDVRAEPINGVGRQPAVGTE